ncbi:PREDICTED: uncharacterized protein LOC105154142 [Acromyrmex echinatior]|uniref:uncharacterized protein LOC105154142 n=1 Tax=Acromyrmex echinatior TaxID=103372 RepID=UPI000580DCA5|nr:PREDICTED: uncharacterized protein LOC105154142 [Acromyrmex echinatior]XP_011067764.1 PREDICTED: uncharacterized protein LOC105154142 [Acromyrmex echinatior]
MKTHCDSYNNGLSCIVMWTSLTCLLFIFSLLTTITAKPTINEIGTKVISKDAINVMCPPIICTLYCPWGFEIDLITFCPICSCWIPRFCAIFCPESQICEPEFLPCLIPPCPIIGITCMNVTSSSIV